MTVTYAVSRAMPGTVSGAAVSGGCTAASAAACCATATAASAATTSALSEQRAGRCDHQCRYEDYRKELGYFRHDGLLFVFQPRVRATRPRLTMFLCSLKIGATGAVPRKERASDRHQAVAAVLTIKRRKFAELNDLAPSAVEG